MKASASGFYAWRANPVSDRDYADAVLTNTIVDVHRRSRRSYGSPRVHADLRLGDEGIRCSRKRVERLVRRAGVRGIYRRKGRGCTRRDPGASPAEDLVERRFTVTGPAVGDGRDRAPHRRGQGLPRDRPRRPEPPRRGVVDRRPRPGRARGRRAADGRLAAPPPEGPVRGAPRPRQPVHELGVRRPPAGRRPARLHGLVGDAYDNALAESFFGTLQLELLDEHRWASRRELALAIFEWIECWHDASRRHSSIRMLSPVAYARAHTSAAAAA